MSSFEIIVLEYTDVYGTFDITDNVVDEFIKFCRLYVNPEYVKKEDAYLTWTRNSIVYSDRSGDDKPRTVMLIGSNIPTSLQTEIQNELESFYELNSDDSGSE